MAERIHIGISKAYLLETIRHNKDGRYLVGFDKDDWPEAIAAVSTIETEFVPSPNCDNVLSDGTCGGHSD